MLGPTSIPRVVSTGLLNDYVRDVTLLSWEWVGRSSNVPRMFMLSLHQVGGDLGNYLSRMTSFGVGKVFLGLHVGLLIACWPISGS